MVPWSVYNGSLYMNYQPAVKARFFANIDAAIACGNKRWAGMWGGLERGPFNTACFASTWKHSPCSTHPQVLPGITPAPTPEPPTPSITCDSALEKACGMYACNPDPCHKCFEDEVKGQVPGGHCSAAAKAFCCVK